MFDHAYMEETHAARTKSDTKGVTDCFENTLEKYNLLMVQ